MNIEKNWKFVDIAQ